MHNFKKDGSQELGEIKHLALSVPHLSKKEAAMSSLLLCSALLCPSSHSLSMKYQLFPLLSSPQSLPAHWRTMSSCVFLGVAD